MDNCRNCGAPLPQSGKCEYCGTEHNRIHSEDDVYYKINFEGSEHICYINSVDVDSVYYGGGRLVDGTVMKPMVIKKMRFELVEA